MIGLHLHVASQPAVLGISSDATLLSGDALQASYGFSEQLMTWIESGCSRAQITLKQLDYLCTTHGPGGYTNTRIGVTTMKSLAQTLSIPLYSFSTLAAFVWTHSPHDGVYLSVLETRSPQCMGQLFRVSKGEVIPLSEAVILNDSGLSQFLDKFKTPITVLGSPPVSSLHRFLPGVVTVEGLIRAGVYYQHHYPDRGQAECVFPLYAYAPVIGPKR